MEERLLTALISFEAVAHPEVKDCTRHLATDAKIRIQGGRKASATSTGGCASIRDGEVEVGLTDVTSIASGCCGLETLPGIGEDLLQALTSPARNEDGKPLIIAQPMRRDPKETDGTKMMRTFLLADSASGRRFVVPADPTGGRAFNDRRVWCYRRGRFCEPDEEPDLNFVWTDDLQQAYEAAIVLQQDSDSEGGVSSRGQ
jgi:hypothetical protein